MRVVRRSAFVCVHMAAKSQETHLRRAALHDIVSEAMCPRYRPIAGVDEVVRFPYLTILWYSDAGSQALAGPVVAASVVLLPPAHKLELPGRLELDDSKRLSLAQRERVYDALHVLAADKTIEISVAFMSAVQVDDLNVLRARLRAMRDAVAALRVVPELLFVDGDRPLDDLDPGIEQRVVKGGDGKVSVIAAASIVAKVERNRLMRGPVHEQFPCYGFDAHVGYGTCAHLDALARHGACAAHRRSYKPVAMHLHPREEG